MRRSILKLKLYAVFIVVAASTVLWTLADRTPPSWDAADHISTAYDFYRPLAHGRIAGFFLESFQAPHSYAPLFHWLTAVVFLFFGATRLTGIAVNLLALVVLLASVNWIGVQLKLQRACVVAALLAVCYHFPAWLIHDAYLDYLLMAMVALAFALLLRADEFHVRNDALIFGVTAGLGMLAKQTFLFFFILPAAFLWIREIRRRDRKAIINLLLSGVIALLIASIWYVPHMNDILGLYRINGMNAAVEHESPVLSPRSLVYYWAILADLQLQIPFFVLFVVGVVYSVRRRAQQDWMLYLWILSGVLSFTFIANKDARYTVPILPAVALLSVSWLDGVRPKFRTWATVGISSLALISFANAQWPSEKLDLRISVWGNPLYFLAGKIVRFDHPPLVEDWSIPEIVRAAAAGNSPGVPAILGVVPNIWQLNPSNVGLQSRLLAGAGGAAPLVRVQWLAEGAAGDHLNRCDYVLARTNLTAAELVSPSEIEMDAYLRAHLDRFQTVAAFALPRSQTAVLYRRIP